MLKTAPHSVCAIKQSRYRETVACWKTVVRKVIFVFSSDGQAGSGPAAAHFSCFAKKSKQKKATVTRQPFGFPLLWRKKWEANETRCAQTTFTSDPFLTPQQRLPQYGFLKRLAFGFAYSIWRLIHRQREAEGEQFLASAWDAAVGDGWQSDQK